MSTIFAREEEVELLTKVYQSERAELVAIYGRRRVGKTFLVSEFFKSQAGYYFELTGVKQGTLKTQLANFTQAFSDCFYQGLLQPTPESWQAALSLLRRKVDMLAEQDKVILFFDELPWLASKRSEFLPCLEHLWNRYLSRLPNVKVIVCGSASTWMIKKIIYNKGGLYGRLTYEIQLRPFNLQQTECYLKARGIQLSRKQIIELYLTIGGVAKYLDFVEKGLSASQIIQKTLFSKTGPLLVEFHKLYASLFDNADNHIAIVTALAKKNKGLTQSEILKETGLSSGGQFSLVLKELEQSGFVLFEPNFGHRKRDGRYRLIDEYSLFYLTWIQPLQQDMQNVSENAWQRIYMSPAYLAWAGYAFEGICLKQADQILDALKLSVVATKMAGWTHAPKKDSEISGAQIDLVIDRADQCTNLCEIKFSNAPYTISKTYADTLRQKKVVFQEVTHTRKSLFTTMITTYGVQENDHYFDSVDNQITMDALFE